MPMNGTNRIVLFILSCLLLLPGCNGAEETVDSSWVVSAGDSKLTPGQFSFFLKTVYNAYEEHAEDMGFST